MDRHKDGDDDKYDPPKELRTIDDAYVFNPSSGLYEPKTYARQDQVDRKAPGAFKKHPLFYKKIGPDWPYIVVSCLGLFVSILTLVLLWRTVYWTHQQWIVMNGTLCEMRRQTSAAKDALLRARNQFRQDQRPYVAESPKSTQPPQFFSNPIDPKSGQVIWTYHFTNFGKTPAYDVRCEQFIKLGTGRFVRSYGESRLGGVVLPPTGDNFNTVVSQPIKKTEYDHLLTMTNGIEIKVRLTYRDSYGVPYETGLCEGRLNLGAIRYCSPNYIK